MKLHSYQHNNPRYNAPTAKITFWFGLVTKEYYHRPKSINRWYSCESGRPSRYTKELYQYGILQQKIITAENYPKGIQC